MNTNAYAGRMDNPSSSEPSSPQSGWDFCRSIFSSNINLPVALAVVVFAAGLVAALGLVANSEIASENYDPVIKSSAVLPSSKVLGIASYGYNQPVCGYNTNNCLNHMLIGYNNGGWQVRIDYQLKNNLVGVIRVNGWKFMDNITGSGSGYTGYDLEPGETYNFVLYKKVGQRLVRLTNLKLTAPDAPAESGATYCASDAYQCPDGTWVGRTGPYCEFICPPPTTPSYGYTVAVLTPAPGSWIEGWIDQVVYGSSMAPGSVKIYGWAEAQGATLNISMTLRNRDTGQEYSPSAQGLLDTRSDVVSYLARVSGAPNPNAYYNKQNSFFAKFENLPAGYYYIYNARYNGNLFNIHSNAYQPIYISQQTPAYGYQSVNVGPVAQGSWREGWIDRAYYGSNQSPGSIKISGWVYDEGKNIFWNNLGWGLKNENTGKVYQSVDISIEQNSRSDVRSYINGKMVVAGADTPGVYTFVAKFENLPAGNYVIYDARYNGYLFNIHNQAYQPIYIGSSQTPSTDLSIIGIREDGDPNVVWMNVCMQGPNSITDLKKTNSNIQGFPWSYAVYDSNNNQYIFEANAGGGIEEIKNGQCMELALGIQQNHQQYWKQTKKITITLDPANLITESNEGNNQLTHKGVPAISVTPAASLGPVTLGDYGLYGGQIYRIKWDSTGIENVYIKLRKNSVGDTVGVISETTRNNGFLDWTVPNNLANGSDYVIRVVAANMGNVYADSAAFSIKAQVPACLPPPEMACMQGQTVRWYTDANGCRTPRCESLDSRLGQIINKNGTIFLVGSGGLYGFSNIDVFNSWGYTFSQVLTANSAEMGMSMVGLVPTKQSGCGSVLDQIAGKCNSGGSTNSTASYRYLKIETTNSNSWVAWREIEAYDASGNKLAPMSLWASGSYSYSTASKAVDGNVDTVWNAGAYSGYIVLDFGSSPGDLKKLRLLPANSPSPASTNFVVSASNDNSNFVELTRFGGNITDNQWWEYNN